MKKILFVLFALCCMAQGKMFAQDNDYYGYFNHLSLGVNVGTTGVGFDLAAPVGPLFRVRAGADLIAKYSTTVDLDFSYEGEYASLVNPYLSENNQISVDGKLNMVSGKVLVDFYPFRNSVFHFTVGAYFANKDVVTINTTPETDKAFRDIRTALNNAHSSDVFGLELGDYLLEPDDNGHVNGAAQTNSFRPYVGIGFGRTVPKKRVALAVDLGTQFWGTPKVMCNGDELTEEKVGGDSGKVFKTISKISVYPVISIRLCGRLF